MLPLNPTRPWRRFATALAAATPRWLAPRTSLLAAALLLYFASSFVAQLRTALDAVWEVRRKSLRRALLERALSFGQTLLAVAAGLLVLAVGVLRSIVWPLLGRSGPAGAMAWMAWTRSGRS